MGGHGHTLLEATGGQIKDAAAGKEKKKALKIQQPATEGLGTQSMERPCLAFRRKMMDVIAGGRLLEPAQSESEADQKNPQRRGVSAAQDAPSAPRLARHQMLRCLQVSRTDNRGEVD